MVRPRRLPNTPIPCRFSGIEKPFPPIIDCNMRRYHEMILSPRGLNTGKNPEEFRKQCKFIVKISKPYYYWYEGYWKSALPRA